MKTPLTSLIEIAKEYEELKSDTRTQGKNLSLVDGKLVINDGFYQEVEEFNVTKKLEISFQNLGTIAFTIYME